jgi:hypothetical protein
LIIHRLSAAEQEQVTQLANLIQDTLASEEYTDKVIVASLLSVTVSVMTVMGIGLSAAIENIRLRFGAVNAIPRPDNGAGPNRQLN